MIYGYCRISRKSQNIERQIRNIKNKYPDAHIIQEAFTGTKIVGRKELDKLLKIVKPNDTIVFDSASRMSRNYEEAVVKAINLGDDTDTVGAITGSIAGIAYGKENIPKRWLSKLRKKELTMNWVDIQQTELSSYWQQILALFSIYQMIYYHEVIYILIISYLPIV